MKTDSVTVSADIAVDPATAFRLFTDEIESWWADSKRPGTGPHTERAGTLRFEPGPDGRLLEVFRDERPPFEIGRVLVWKPADRLVFEWRQGNFEPGQVTEVEIRFEPADAGTRVTVEHRGFDALPADHSTRHGLGVSEPFVLLQIGWWARNLASLRAFAERR